MDSNRSFDKPDRTSGVEFSLPLPKLNFCVDNANADVKTVGKTQINMYLLQQPTH